MIDSNILAGPALRRLRKRESLTQAAMAGMLGISPSYLNLIERNQRPLTVQLLLKLASVYKIDIEDLHGERGSVAGDLKAVFADPLLSGEIPGNEELVEVAEAAPNAAQGIIKLYDKPFNKTRHEALGVDDFQLGKWKGGKVTAYSDAITKAFTAADFKR